MTNEIDHLVFATPDLAQGVDEIEALTGVRASIGGQHALWGTHNRLLALGNDAGARRTLAILACYVYLSSAAFRLHASE